MVLPRTRWSVAYGAVVLGVLLLGLVAWSAQDQLGTWQYLLYLAAALIWFGTLRGMDRWSGDQDSSADPLEIVADKETALQELAAQLDRREQALASQMVTYHEWMEFPRPTDLSDTVETDEQLAELVELDRQAIELLENVSKEIFDAILENRYSVDGKFQPSLLMQQAWQLADQVARIYQPSSDNPLLETSTEQIFYAISRACLQFLVVVEELPLNVKELNINSLYGYVRRAVQAYGVYKRARPFLQVAGKGYYLGRYAMGVNPVSMGAWWMLQSVGSRGAKALATRVVNRQALGLLNNIVRVIGFEVATIYGGDFRHRDPNWIYGAELTELLATFPVSGEMLTRALGEVGAIQLRSEYDRIYLYRCLAAARSSDPGQYRAATVLTVAERQAIADRLQRFAARSLPVEKSRLQKKWWAQVEKRLGIELASIAETNEVTPAQRQEVLQSLAGYVLTVKEHEISELPVALAGLAVYESLADEDRQALWDGWQADPPVQFEPPSLPTGSSLADEYLQGLVQLAARLAPRLATDQSVVQAAGYVGLDEAGIKRQLANAYRNQLQESCPGYQLPQRLPVTVTCALLDLLEPGETIQRVYRGVQATSCRQGEVVSGPKKSCWLIAVSSRAVMLSDAEEIRVMWQSNPQVDMEKQAGLVRSDCRLAGGDWLVDKQEPVTLVVTGDPLVGYDEYFQPLTSLFTG